MPSTLPRIGLGILSWRGHESLSRVLPTYQTGGLFDLVDEAVLFLPEARQETVALGQRFGLTVRTAPANLGILGGFSALAEMLRAEHLLLLEDDCPLVEPAAEAARQLRMGSAALAADEVQVFRMRHRFYPGAGARFTVPQKLHRYHPPDNAPAPDRRIAALRRLCRPGKAAKLSGNVLYEQADGDVDPYLLNQQRAGGLSPDPKCLHARAMPAEEKFGARLEKMPQGYYRVSARIMPWSNQSILVPRAFYLDKIARYAAAHPSRRRVNGFPDVEKELNSPYWRTSGWAVGIDRGLFTHELV